jgi:thymidylate synthase (FAD)
MPPVLLLRYSPEDITAALLASAPTEDASVSTYRSAGPYTRATWPHSFTHELVRHRHLSFSQLSQRFVDESQAAFVPPPLLRDDPEALALLEAHHKASLAIYRRLVAIAEAKLADTPGLDRTARRKRAREAARCVLPNMTETQIVVTGNHRAWREFLEKRATEHADAEMREVALQVFRIARLLAPATYQDFREEALPSGEIVLRRP